MNTFDIIHHIFQFFETTFYKNFRHYKVHENCNNHMFDCDDCYFLKYYNSFDDYKLEISNSNKILIQTIFNMRHINSNFSIVFFKSNISHFYFEHYNIQLPKTIETQLKYFPINTNLLYYYIDHNMEIEFLTNLSNTLLIDIIDILYKPWYPFSYDYHSEIINELIKRFQQNKNFAYWLSFSNLHVIEYFHKTFDIIIIENIDKEIKNLINNNNQDILEYLIYNMYINLNENIFTSFKNYYNFYDTEILLLVKLLIINPQDLESKEFLDKIFLIIYYSCEFAELEVIKYLYDKGFRKKHFRLDQVNFDAGQTLIDTLIHYHHDDFFQYILEKDLI